MNENKPTNEEQCPCMGLLSLRVLVKMWNSTPVEDCTLSRKEVSRCLTSLISQYPNGGEELLNKVVELSRSKREKCNKEEAETWEYVSGLVETRLAKA